MTNIVATQLPCMLTPQQQVPKEGPISIPVPLDFTTDTEYDLDYSNMQGRDKFSILQTVFIDNADMGQALTITMNGTGQRIICPANSQGYFPVLSQNPVKLAFTTAVLGVAAKVYLCNFPVAPCVWHV